MPLDNTLPGKRILVVEDDFFICDDLTMSLQDRGAEVVGPAASIEQALDLIARTAAIDAAVLDINLQGRMSFPVAKALLARGVPFVFATGYAADVVPDGFADVPRYEKPVNPDIVASRLFGG